MRCLIFASLCFIGLVVADEHQSSHSKWASFLQSVGERLSHSHDNGNTCDRKDRKNHAIALLQEWVKHNHYDAVEKLYHDIYHHDLNSGRKRQWHYQSTFDEAFNHGNTDPDYLHVESYITVMMNQACRNEIMKWIENLAKTHTPNHHNNHHTHAPTTQKQTHAPKTQAPTTHAPKTAAPTTHAPNTPEPTTKAQAMMAKSCDAVTFVTALARGTVLTHEGAGLCTDGTKSQPEALILESCKAPQIHQWTQGPKVMGNCKNIPDYSPVAMFSFGTYVQDGSAVAGILTECTNNGFKIAIQLCGHPVNVYDLKSGAADPKQNADNYYIINW